MPILALARPSGTNVPKNDAIGPHSKVSRDAVRKRDPLPRTSYGQYGGESRSSLRRADERLRSDKCRGVFRGHTHTSLLRVGLRRVPAAHDDNFVIRVENSNSTPCISRKLSVPIHCNMVQLSLAFQMALGLALAVAPHELEGEWLRYHSWEFWFVKGRRSGDPRRTIREQVHEDYGARDEDDEGESLDAAITKLSDLLIEPEWFGPWRHGRCLWRYDLGQDWAYKVEFLGRTSRTLHISCLEGSGHPVAEDTGPERWGSIVGAYRKPEDEWNDSERDSVNWYEQVCMNGDPEGLRGDRMMQFIKPDKDEVNELLKGIM